MELLGKSKNELRDFCVGLGEPAYRGGQIYHALYAERKSSVREISNLPASLRERLASESTITLPAVRQTYASQDGSVRYLFGLPDSGADAKRKSGPASVEAVFMPSAGRQTILVLMGQGEPLLNFDAVMAALRIILDPEGLALTPKHVTLSTSGIVPGIERLAQEKIRPKLAISLNASNDEQRDSIMPINRKYPLAALMEACRSYPLRPWEHLTFEYVMLGGVNDSPEDARKVVRLLANLKSVKVNLIPWNPGELPYRESSAEAIEAFRKILVERDVPTFVRYSRGRDVMAACGQLALLNIAPAGAAAAVSPT